jgi:hypothetical protein
MQMLKRILYVLACTAIAGTGAAAHHSYAEYDREHPMSIEGTLEQLTIGNPHSMLVVRTDEGALFTAEWGNVSLLQRTGFVAGMLAVGDRVVVTGCPTWNRETRRMSLLREIRRPTDGWQWSRSGVTRRGE